MVLSCFRGGYLMEHSGGRGVFQIKPGDVAELTWLGHAVRPRSKLCVCVCVGYLCSQPNPLSAWQSVTLISSYTVIW